jgi:hypothetical protein
VEVNSVLGPVVAIGDQLENAALSGGMGMDDFKGIIGTVGVRCN